MNTPPVLTGDRRTDRALLTLARLLGEIAASTPDSANTGHPPAAHDDTRQETERDTRKSEAA